MVLFATTVPWHLSGEIYVGQVSAKKGASKKGAPESGLALNPEAERASISSQPAFSSLDRSAITHTGITEKEPRLIYHGRHLSLALSLMSHSNFQPLRRLLRA